MTAAKGIKGGPKGVPIKQMIPFGDTHSLKLVFMMLFEVFSQRGSCRDRVYPFSAPKGIISFCWGGVTDEAQRLNRKGPLDS